jgi:putative nucleotidyltransferase with HDIG domain
MNKGDLKNIIKSVESFPSLSASAPKLMSLLFKSETNADQIEDALRYDPGLTANILKLTNSAYFGFSGKIGSVRQAIVILGRQNLIKLVITSCVRAIIDKEVLGYELTPGQLWRHSTAVSVAAEGLVRELKFKDCDLIYTAALLHDVGKLVLGRFVLKDLSPIEVATAHGLPFDIAVHQVLGINHAEIGAMMLKNWCFPDDIIQAVRWHHRPDCTNGNNQLVDIVHVADVLCMMMGYGVGREGLQYSSSPTSTARLGLKQSHLERVASQTLQWVEEISEVFDGRG